MAPQKKVAVGDVIYLMFSLNKALSSVLHSPRAVQVNIEIMRAFVRLRQMLASNIELSRRLDELESNYDGKFKIVFDAIRQLMTPVSATRKQIGFQTTRRKT